VPLSRESNKPRENIHYQSCVIWPWYSKASDPSRSSSSGYDANPTQAPLSFQQLQQLLLEGKASISTCRKKILQLPSCRESQAASKLFLPKIIHPRGQD
jgi:hypothetical protein